MTPLSKCVNVSCACLPW